MGFAFVAGALVGTYEKEDELTTQNLLRATEYTFFITLGALFVCGVIIENFYWSTAISDIATNLFYYVLLVAIAVRSIIFLCLDIVPTLKSDEEEEAEEETEENEEENDKKIDIEKIKAELKEQIKLELQEEMNKTQETVSDEKVGEIVEANEEISEKPKTRKRKTKECEEE